MKTVMKALTWYVGLWLMATTTLGALALSRWAIQQLGWLP